MLMRLANLSDWVKKEMGRLKKKQKWLEINPDKAYSVQEFKDEHGEQRYTVIIQAQLEEGVYDEADD